MSPVPVKVDTRAANTFDQLAHEISTALRFVFQEREIVQIAFSPVSDPDTDDVIGWTANIIYNPTKRRPDVDGNISPG